jgi:chromosome segregation ATPase
MSITVSPRQPGVNSPHADSGNHHDRPAEGSAPDLLVDDEELRRQLELLAADNEQLLAALGLKPAAEADGSPTAEPGSIEEENGQLRARVAALEEQLSAVPPSEDSWTEQQKAYEALLEEKSEVIRTLHQKIQELRDGGANPSGGAGRSGDGSAQQSDLEELRAQLEAEREQLRQDEASVMQQMTQMEMTMSRERAEMARQRNELQRLHSDIRHELETASRDTVLRDRLAPFQRRHQEVSGRKGAAASAEPAPPLESEAPASSADTSVPKKNPGLLRRFFG